MDVQARMLSLHCVVLRCGAVQCGVFCTLSKEGFRSVWLWSVVPGDGLVLYGKRGTVAGLVQDGFGGVDFAAATAGDDVWASSGPNSMVVVQQCQLGQLTNDTWYFQITSQHAAYGESANGCGNAGCLYQLRFEWVPMPQTQLLSPHGIRVLGTLSNQLLTISVLHDVLTCTIASVHSTAFCCRTTRTSSRPMRPSIGGSL